MRIFEYIKSWFVTRPPLAPIDTDDNDIDSCDIHECQEEHSDDQYENIECKPIGILQFVLLDNGQIVVEMEWDSDLETAFAAAYAEMILMTNSGYFGPEIMMILKEAGENPEIKEFIKKIFAHFAEHANQSLAPLVHPMHAFGQTNSMKMTNGINNTNNSQGD